MKRCCSTSSYNLCPPFICQVSKGIFACEEPTEDEEFVALIKEHGIKSLLNTRVPDEEDYEDRTSFANKNGIACVNFPISSLDIVSCDTLKQLFEKVQKLEQPIMFLGRSGPPTAGLALWYYAASNGLSEEETIQHAATLEKIEEDHLPSVLKLLARSKPASSSR